MKDLYTKKEKELLELKFQKKCWKKQFKNKNSKYSNSFIFKMIDEIDNNIKALTKKQKKEA